METQKARKRGRPVEKPMPERIDRDPEDVAKVLMRTPVKDTTQWKYLEKKNSIRGIGK